MLAAVCSTEIFTQRYYRCNNDKEIKLISVTLMWQQIIHGSIRSHFHSTTQRQRIPWSMAVNGSLYQPLWKPCLITHSNTTVPRVVDFPNGHWFTDQRLAVLHITCFSMHGAQMPSCCKCAEFFLWFVCFWIYLSGNSLRQGVEKRSKCGVNIFLMLCFVSKLELESDVYTSIFSQLQIIAQYSCI